MGREGEGEEVIGRAEEGRRDGDRVMGRSGECNTDFGEMKDMMRVVVQYGYADNNRLFPNVLIVLTVMM